MTDLDSFKGMLQKCGASFDEEILDEPEVRIPSVYDEAKCEIVFVFKKDGELKRVAIVPSDASRSGA